MKEARELVKQDLDNLKEEVSAFEKLTKTLDEVHFGSTVKLNNGGKIHKTTIETLRKDVFRTETRTQTTIHRRLGIFQ